ncbi:MAG: N-acetylmuramoyl-L-alanine amidase family protein [Nocardioidaceae bacterium]
MRRRRLSSLLVLAAIVVLVLVVALVIDHSSGRPDAPTAHTVPTTAQPTATRPRPAPKVHQLAVHHLVGTLNPTSCIFYPPTHGDRHRTVFLDPGHGGNDPGTEGQDSRGVTVHEKVPTLAVAKRAAVELRARGFAVVMSRTADATVMHMTPRDLSGKLMTPAAVHNDIVDRVACANTAHAAALVSIHFNSFTDPTVGGADTNYDTSRPFGARNRQLARLVQHDILHGFHSAGWAVPNRGIRNQYQDNAAALTAQGNAYGHLFVLGPRKTGWNLHPSKMPGVLIEPLFLSRPTEADVAESAHGQQVIATAITDALTTFLSR